MNLKEYDEYLPERLLINKTDIEVICTSFIKKDKVPEIITLLVGVFISCLCAALTEHFKNKVLNLIIIFLLPVIIVSLCRFLFYTYKSRSLLAEIYNFVIDKSKHTAVFLISRKRVDPSGRKEIELLTMPHGTNERFIIYSDLDKKMIERLDEKEITKKLASRLKIDEKAISIEHLKTHNYIKRTESGGEEKLIKYEFYKTKIDEDFKKALKKDKELQWKTLDTLKSDVKSQIYNHDVIAYIDENLRQELDDSFFQSTDKPIKIIWNITKNCAYHCKICATDCKDRQELNVNEKAKALLSILTVGNNKIKELDFSGGDPLWDIDSRKIIKYAKGLLDYDKIFITTTGKGIEKAMDDGEGDLSKLLSSCEITIEDGDAESDNRRQEKDYSNKNGITMERAKTEIYNLVVNVPILHPNMSDENIKKLVEKICRIKAQKKSAILIRLMKVGKMTDNYPEDYDPENFITKFQEYAKEHNLETKLQCALRGRYSEGSCNMLEEKIGVDCAGNVFACAWGGYLKKPVDNNPFYLGNLLEKDLVDILKNDKSLTQKAHLKNTRHCRVFSYLESGKWNEDHDPLFR